MKKLLLRLLLLVILVTIVYLAMEWPLFLRPFYPLEYRNLILSHANENQLDPALVAAVIKVESNFQPQAVSRRGARGLMQLMPNTAEFVIERLGEAAGDDLAEDLCQPAFNIRLGTWYLAHLTRYYQHDMVKVLAAYNAGPTKVDTWLDEGTWDGTMAGRQQIPYNETRDYLARVWQAWDRYSRIYSWPAE